VIPGDALAAETHPGEHNVWHYTQQVTAAAEYARAHDQRYVCNISCFSAVRTRSLNTGSGTNWMAGHSACVEIDSHTAHAGIETRVGAFLDIVEASRRRAGPALPQRRRATPARLAQEGPRTWIVTGTGRKVALDDPQVVHVSLLTVHSSSRTFSPASTLHWLRSVFLPNTNAEVLQYAKRVCSGRECLPFLAMVGKAVRYLESRSEGEVTVFDLMEQEGRARLAAGTIPRR